MQQDYLIGAVLGNYKIVAPLGQGGMARVYRAYQENLDREVAIKVLPPWYAADRNFVERFNLEARMVARLSHPNIVTVHDASEQHGNLYIVMQLVDGGTLKQRLDMLRGLAGPGRVGTMDIAEASRIFQQLASALQYAHEQGIIHRDVKPVNVLMDRSGRPILSDFGIAKALAGVSTKALTRPGAGVGTPEYMSPEQCTGEQVDGRADIYALGVMLFEALTGRTPFIGENYPTLAHCHVYENPPDPLLFNSEIPLAVRDVILTALQKQPGARYQQAVEMSDALERAAEGGIVGAGRPQGMTLHFVEGATPHLLEAVSSLEASESPTHTHIWTDAPQAPENTPTKVLTPMAVSPVPSQLLYSCPYCQSVNKPEVFYCTRCGSPLNLCPACYRQNRARDRFCTSCGQALR